MTEYLPVSLQLSRRELLGALLAGIAAALLALLGDWKVTALLAAAPLFFGAAWWILAAPHRWWAGFAAATLLFPPLPLDWGNTGPHAAVLFAGLGIWAGLLRLPEWRLPRFDALWASAVFFLSALLLSVPLAWLYSGASAAGGSLVRVLLLAIAFYALFAFAYGPMSSGLGTLGLVRVLYWLGLAAVLLACIDFSFQISPPAGFSEQYVWLPGRIMRRAQGFFYDAGVLGNLCAFFLVMLALLALRPETRRQLMSRKALLAGCAVFSMGLLFSFSRSSLVNFAVALGALAIVHRTELQSYSRRIALALAAMIAGAVLAAFLFPGYVQIYASRVWYMIFRGFVDPEGLLSGRLQTWSALADFLGTHPWHFFFGVGFKTLPYTSIVGRPLVTDNMYLSLLVETGLPGLLAMLLFSAALLHAGYRALRSPNSEASFLGAWIFCFWIGQLVQMLWIDALTYWRVLPLYFAILGLAVREANRSLDADRREP